jgi:hypothetical protein
MPGYGLSNSPANAEKYPWSWAVEHLAKARNYWVASTRPDGRPHAMPVWGLWLDDAFMFSTGRSSRKGRNLLANPYMVVHLESGDDVVVLEGVVEEVRDPVLLARFADDYDAKYNFRVNVTNTTDLFYALRPQVAFTWVERNFVESATRWRWTTDD